MSCARYLGVYDIEKMYDYTMREFINLKKGAELAVIDYHERNIQAAWVSGIVSRPTKGRPKGPDKYFDAKKARKEITNEGKEENKQDNKPYFGFFDQMREDMKNFDWQANYLPKER